MSGRPSGSREASSSTSTTVTSPSSSSSSTAPPAVTTSTTTSSTTTPSTSPTPPATPTTSSSSSTSTTSSSSSSSVSSTSPISTTSSSTPASSSTTTFQSTSVGVSNGVTFTSIITETATLAPGSVATGTTPTHQSTNVGPIVGGVVGGVGGFAALLLLVFLLIRWRRKRRLEEMFDGDFDPGRVTSTNGQGGASVGGTLPNIIVPEEDDGMGGRLAASDLGIRGTVTPFYDPRHGPGPQPQMSEKARIFAPQDNRYGYPQSGSSSSHGHGPVAFSMPHGEPGPGSSSSDAGYAHTARSSSVTGYYSQTPLLPQQQQQFHSPSTSEVTSSRGGKEHEARPLVSNPDQGTSVVVHHDGGRVEEIPPSYDSLPAGDRR